MNFRREAGNRRYKDSGMTYRKKAAPCKRKSKREDKLGEKKFTSYDEAAAAYDAAKSKEERNAIRVKARSDGFPIG